MVNAKSMAETPPVINRWVPTSQRCSACGESGGKKELDVREWQCLYCGVCHDRDVNAAINILDAGGLSESLNGCGSKCKTTTVAVCIECCGGNLPPANYRLNRQPT